MPGHPEAKRHMRMPLDGGLKKWGIYLTKDATPAVKEVPDKVR